MPSSDIKLSEAVLTELRQLMLEYGCAAVVAAAKQQVLDKELVQTRGNKTTAGLNLGMSRSYVCGTTRPSYLKVKVKK